MSSNPRHRSRKSKKSTEASPTPLSNESQRASQDNRLKAKEGGQIYMKLIRLAQRVLDNNDTHQNRQNAAFTLETELLHVGGHPDVSKAILVLMNGDEQVLPLGTVFEEPAVSSSVKKGVVRALAAILATYRGATTSYFKWLFSKIFYRHTGSDDIQLEYVRVLKEVIDPKLPRSEKYLILPHTLEEIVKRSIKLLENTESSSIVAVFADILHIINRKHPEISASHSRDIVRNLVRWIGDKRLSRNQFHSLLSLFESIQHVWVEQSQLSIDTIQYLTAQICEYMGAQVQSHLSVGGTLLIRGEGNMSPLSDEIYRLWDVLLPVLKAISENIHESDPSFTTAQHQFATIMELVTEILHHQFTFSFARRVVRILALPIDTFIDQYSSWGHTKTALLVKLVLQMRTAAMESEKQLDEMCLMLDLMDDEFLPTLKLAPVAEIFDLFFSTDQNTSLLAVVLNPSFPINPRHLKTIDRCYNFILKIVDCLSRSSSIHSSHLLSNKRSLIDDCNFMILRLESWGADPKELVGVSWIDSELSESNLVHILQNHLSLVQAVISVPVPILDNKVVFTSMSHSILSVSSKIKGSHWWVQIESKFLVCLYQISQAQDFFVPALHLRPDELSYHTNFDLECKIIHGLCSSRRVKRTQFGHRWLRSLINVLQKKNRLDIDVADSCVLSKIETILLELLDQCRVHFEPRFTILVAETWECYFSRFATNHRGHPGTKTIMDMFIQLADDNDASIRDAFVSALSSIDTLDTLSRFDLSTLHTSMNQGNRDFGNWDTLLPEEYLHMFVNAIGVNYNLQTDMNLHLEVDSMDQFWTWVQDVVHLRHNALFRDNLAIKQSESTRSFLRRWSSWNAASCLVQMKLKLFGDPLSTLQNIEQALNRYVAILMDDSFSENGGMSFPSRVSILERLSIFIDFIDCLNIQILKAAEGTFHHDEKFSLNVASFFMANLHVCQEWFYRIRDRLLQLSIFSNRRYLFMRVVAETIIPPGSLNLKKQSNDIHKLIESYLQKGEVDNLVGLEHWLAQTSSGFDAEYKKSPLFKCIKAATFQSEFRIEKALKAYSEELFSASHFQEFGFSPDIFSAWDVNKLRALYSIYDWNSVSTFFNHEATSSTQRLALEWLSRWSQEPSWQDPSNNTFAPCNLFNKDALEHKNLYSSLLVDILLLDPFTSHDEFPCKLEQAVRSVQALHSFDTSYDLSWIIDIQLLKYQNRLITSAMEEKPSTQIRFAQAKSTAHIPKSPVHALTFDQWYRVYNLRNRLESQTKDPDLDELRGLLANVARKCENISLAQSLLDRSQISMTPSASLRTTYKYAKLMIHQKDFNQGATTLIRVVNTPLDIVTDADKEVKAKAYLLLADLQSRKRDSPIDRIGTVPANNEGYSQIVRPELAITANILSRAVDISSSSFHKPAYQYASFCYSLVRQIMSGLRDPQTMDTEKSAIFSSQFLAPISAFPHTIQSNIFQRILNEFSKADEIADGSTTAITPHTDLSAEEGALLDSFVGTAKEQILEVLKQSMHFYFQYLHLVSDSVQKKSMSLTATLRLLRLLTLYGRLLKDEFRMELKETVLNHWLQVIPQLFSRLLHPDSFVQESISSLLLRLGDIMPESILFPTLLATNVHAKDKKGTDYDADFILAHLRTKYANLVESTSTAISFMNQLAILWEEAWFSELDRFIVRFRERLAIVRELMSKFDSAEADLDKLKQHYVSIAIVPCLDRVKDLYRRTLGRGAASENEKLFVEEYGVLVDNFMSCVNLFDLSNDQSSLFEAFDKLFTKLQKLSSRSRKLLVHDVCPLNEFLLEHRSVPMPGQHISNRSSRTSISSCDAEMTVIPTKTKPKRIQFQGTDGRQYQFLLKGHEDLRLDERMQQFLAISNLLLSVNKEAGLRNLAARTYSVTPFSTNVGLIEWVENAPSLYSIFRKWEHRRMAILSSRKGSLDDDPKTTSISKSMALYRHFVRESLNARQDGSRSQASFDTSHEKISHHSRSFAFNEMKKITSASILSNELLASSLSSESYLAKQTRYTRSVATMSILGHIIGLGDRHLDNILIDIHLGDVIHIDFNVCLEKGKRLSVPETVPFRLTRNMVQAFGPFGVEGRFKVASKLVLETMKEETETLLTLLEAFVYDPLVIWADSANEEDHNYRNLYYYSRYKDMLSRADIAGVKDLAQDLSRVWGSIANNFDVSIIKESWNRICSYFETATSKYQKFLGTQNNIENSQFLRSVQKICHLWHEIKIISWDGTEKDQSASISVNKHKLKEFLQVFRNEILAVWESGSGSSILSTLAINGGTYEKPDEQHNVQVANEHAVRAIRKIKSKLDGIEDLDGASVRLSVHDQVHHLVNVAMDESVLCRMYEGWLPWL